MDEGLVIFYIFGLFVVAFTIAGVYFNMNTNKRIGACVASGATYTECYELIVGK